MRIAFFGGSFDPPHRGHLAIARAAIERLALDRVWMAPSGVQPLKRGAESTSFEDRLAMVELAAAGQPKIEASALDAPRGDGRPNYTVDVLIALRSNLAADDELFFLLGADAFLTLKQWHHASELPLLCNLIVAGRPGFSIADVPAALPQGIHAEQLARSDEAIHLWTLRDETGHNSKLYLMPDLVEDISATDIRAAIAGDQSAEGVLCSSVLRYIEEKGLYR